MDLTAHCRIFFIFDQFFPENVQFREKLCLKVAPSKLALKWQSDSQITPPSSLQDYQHSMIARDLLKPWFFNLASKPQSNYPIIDTLSSQVLGSMVSVLISHNWSYAIIATHDKKTAFSLISKHSSPSKNKGTDENLLQMIPGNFLPVQLHLKTEDSRLKH